MFNIMTFKDNTWQAAEYEGYFEITLMMYEYWLTENGKDFEYNASNVKIHQCTEKDREYFNPRSDLR